MTGGMNFGYNVIANGIGGVYAGGVEGGSTFKDSSSSVINKVRILDWLVKNHKQNAINDGYIKLPESK